MNENTILFDPLIGEFSNAGPSRYRKAIIKVGEYIHPRTKKPLSVTLDRMRGWVDSFNAMKRDGIDVEFVADHSPKVDDNLGYVTEMSIEGDTLWGVHEARNERATNLIQSVKNTSARIERYIGGNGVDYGEAITHNSIVQGPVIPALGDFIALSIDGPTEPPVYRAKMEKDMEAFLLSLKTILGSDAEDFDEAKAVEAIKAIKDQSVELSAKVGSDAELATVKAELEALKAKTPEPVELSIDPEVKEARCEVIGTRLDNLVLLSRITPNVRRKLGELIDKDVYLLSKHDNGSVVGRLICDILEENEVLPLKEKSGAQVLSRHAVEPSEVDQKEIDRRAERVARSANVTATAK